MTGGTDHKGNVRHPGIPWGDGTRTCGASCWWM